MTAPSGPNTHADTIREALPLLSRFEHQPLCQSFFDNGGTPLPCNCIVAKTEDAIAALDALVAEVERERARADRAEAALAKLVALKDGPRGTEYGRNKPAAWEAARAALSAGSGGQEPT